MSHFSSQNDVKKISPFLSYLFVFVYLQVNECRWSFVKSSDVVRRRCQSQKSEEAGKPDRRIRDDTFLFFRGRRGVTIE